MLAIAGLLLLLACFSVAHAQSSSSSSWPRILLFTKTAGFRHDSIPAAVDVITRLGSGALTLDSASVDSSVASQRWTTVHSEDASRFQDQDYLNSFDAIVFAFTTDVDPPNVGSLLTDAQTANFLTYIQKGGNFVGIHSATNALYRYPAYGRLAGAFFTYHAQSQDVSLAPITRSHPSVSKLPSPFKIKEEMYHLRSNPRDLPSPAIALLTNSSAYRDPGGRRDEGNPQPLAWYREGSLLNSTSRSLNGDLDGQTQFSGGAGRAWVTTLGHETATWSLPSFQGHVQGGIGWVLNASTLNTSGNGTASNGTTSAQPPSGSSASPSAAAPSSDPMALILAIVSGLAAACLVT